MDNPIICAIDTTDIDQAKQLITSTRPYVGAYKLGLEFFMRHGVDGVTKLAEQNIRIFLDLKLHDIPNTVAGAMRALRDLPIFMLTIHTQGGLAMMQAAMEQAATWQKPPVIVGVSVLTSMDAAELQALGCAREPEDQVLLLAERAMQAGLNGLVCSAQEATLLRQHIGNTPILVTPGIRPTGSALDDQSRIMTPRAALDAGANWLVIGRPITQAPAPSEAAQAIWESIQTV